MKGRAGVRQLLSRCDRLQSGLGNHRRRHDVMNCITVRSGKRRLIDAVQHAPDENAALAIIENEVEPELQSMLEPDRADAFRRSILRHIPREPLASSAVAKEDFYGALACFWLVSSFVPACLIAIFFFSNPHLALRISNFLLIALLFLVGQKWAQYAGTNRLAAGAAMVAIGLVLVGIAIPLGG